MTSGIIDATDVVQGVKVDELAAAGRAWARAKDRERERMEELYAAIVAYCADGGSEAEAARIAGVDRMTVRRALGKR